MYVLPTHAGGRTGRFLTATGLLLSVCDARSDPRMRVRAAVRSRLDAQSKHKQADYSTPLPSDGNVYELSMQERIAVLCD